MRLLRRCGLGRPVVVVILSGEPKKEDELDRLEEEDRREDALERRRWGSKSAEKELDRRRWGMESGLELSFMGGIMLGSKAGDRRRWGETGEAGTEGRRDDSL